ncbi:bifunctional diaminohydroxyphosphoribosylaminopyrimidine deaminase/5-amino-6-(5-phosphoribosylamino)uracil reductase RibD [soil metagenome]
MQMHEQYMLRCLQLAEYGSGNVAPNPMVGAVLVHNNKIIGEGYHKKYGEAHAEVNCIKNVSEENKHLICKSTLYVSLEPCNHFGKTPPCSDLIIKKNIANVVIGCKDIYKETAGKGIEKLKSAGIAVATGILEKECIEINKRFNIFHIKKRPYIILKWAESADGKIAASPKSSPKERTLISNSYSNTLVHKWRSEEAAILIGTNTALQDDPLLTTRLWKGKNPVRIVIDMNLRLPNTLKIFNDEAKTIIFNSIKDEEQKNFLFYKINAPDILNIITKSLYKLNIQSVIVEGGAKLLQSFIDAGLWDEVRIITNEKLIVNNGVAAPNFFSDKLTRKEKYFSDTISYYSKSSNIVDE